MNSSEFVRRLLERKADASLADFARQFREGATGKAAERPVAVIRDARGRAIGFSVKADDSLRESAVPTQTMHLLESGTLAGASADANRPVVRGVKLLGEQSLNRRRYLPESVQPSQYNRVPVYLNHPVGSNTQRRVEDKFGWIENPRKDGNVWRGDIHYNPEHPYAKQFAWLAKNNPSLIGLSHDALGEGVTKNGIFEVSKVHKVRSVDLVADPATTNGLYESAH